MMHLKGLMISQFLVALMVKDGSAFSCVPCYLLSGCPELNCMGGKVLGLCGCCSVCAKQLDEQCGGLYGLIGTCDQGLHCVLPPQEVNETITIIHHVGVCQAKTTPRPEAATRPAKGHETPSTPRHETPTAPGKPLLTEHKIPDHNDWEKTTARQDATARPAKPTLKHDTSTPHQGGVLNINVTLGHKTSTARQASSGLSNTNTTPDQKVQNGVPAILRTKGVYVLCLITSLGVLSSWK